MNILKKIRFRFGMASREHSVSELLKFCFSKNQVILKLHFLNSFAALV